MNEATEVPSDSDSEDDEEIDEAEGSEDSDQEEEEDKQEEIEEGGEKHAVQEILDHQELKTVGTKYLVWWKGHPRAKATWEPARNLTGSHEALKEYKAKQSAKEAESVEDELQAERALDRMSADYLGRLKAISAQFETEDSLTWRKAAYDEKPFFQSGDAITLGRLASTVPADYEGELEGMPSWRAIVSEVLTILPEDELKRVAEFTIMHAEAAESYHQLNTKNCNARIILKFFASWLYLGTKMKGGKLAVGEKGIASLWGHGNYYDPVIASSWGRDHFVTLHSNISMVDPKLEKGDSRSEHPGWKQLEFVQGIYDKLEASVTVGGAITIDDTLSRCRSKRGAPIITIKDKREKHGLKDDQAGCPESGYIMASQIHGGKAFNQKVIQRTGLAKLGITIIKIALLVAPYLDSGRVLVLDRGYGSVKLAYVLHHLGFRFILMCRKPRKSGTASKDGLPYDQLSKSKVKGDISYTFCTLINTACVRWVDSAEVYVLSNCAGPEVLQNVRRWDKTKGNFAPRPEPYVVSVYQLLHGAIDKSDRRQNEVGFNHKVFLYTSALASVLSLS